jgi:hypothetical protein
MMRVQSRSRPESTIEAINEREDEKNTAAILAMRRRMFAITLIWIERLFSVNLSKVHYNLH